MRKLASVVVALALTAGLSTFALAAPGGGPGNGPGYGPAWTQLTPEQRTELEKARAQFLTETQAIREKLAVKRVELSTLRAQPNADPAKLKALSDEMVDLGAQLAKKRNDFLAKHPYAFGPGFGRGFHRGFGGGWGGGYCGGPGYGMGYGYHMGPGYGMGPGGSY